MDTLSICITLKNRASFMKEKLEELLTMNYDPKRLEICVTDGGSSDNLVEVLKSYAGKFLQIKYAISDRSALPFVIPENNPACDINAQICNVASFPKIVRTDAEVRFRHKDSLKYISDTLSKDRELCIVFHCIHLNKDFVMGEDPEKYRFSYAKMSFHCSCFWKNTFIRNRGVDERFALGFAAEDSYFHRWWRKNRRLIHPPAGWQVLHLWHGKWQSENRLKLKHEYSMPMYLRFLKSNMTPNKGNDNWQRPEMIKEVHIWKS